MNSEELILNFMLWMGFIIPMIFTKCLGSFQPYFLQTSDFRKVIVKEDLSPGSIIMVVQCKDLDQNPCFFDIESVEMPKNLLRIQFLNNTASNLILANPLDREVKSSYSFYLTVSDNPSDITCKIRTQAFLYVDDVNDEKPQFLPFLNPISIDEDLALDTSIAKLSAYDLDSSYFGALTFKLQEISVGNEVLTKNNTFFTIEPIINELRNQDYSHLFSVKNIQNLDATTIQSFQIKLKRSLDFETQRIHQILITARDGGSVLPIDQTLSSNATLIINVRDIADMPPKFTQSSYIHSLPENMPEGTRVIRVRAVDGDIEINNAIRYSITNITINQRILSQLTPNTILHAPFQIDAESGQILVDNHIDREALESQYKSSTFAITVRAEEIESNSQSKSIIWAETNVIVHIDDVNDCAPTFNRLKFYGIVPENTPNYSTIQFYDFKVHPFNGFSKAHMSLAGQLEKYQMRQDGIEIKILDLDLGENSVFDLRIDGQFSSYFDISPSHASKEISPVLRIINNTLLDREKIQFIYLKIYATESSTKEKMESIVDLTIEIQDVNDEKPYLLTTVSSNETENNQYMIIGGNKILINVSEDRRVGDRIFHLQARDDDYSEKYSMIRYEKLYGEFHEKFSIDEFNGWILLNSTLDRETISRYILNVDITDGNYMHMYPTANTTLINGQINKLTVEIEINILDINDNWPIFIQSSYDAYLVEGQKAFRQPLHIKAQDADDPQSLNSKVQYRFVYKSDKDRYITSHFDLNSENGLIQPSNVTIVDYETVFKYLIDNALVFMVEAYDLGSPSLSNLVSVKVEIEDANDNRPVFPKSIAIIYVPETLKSDTIIYNVSAKDNDIYSAYNGDVNYFFNISQESPKFWLNPETGALTLLPMATLNLDLLSKSQMWGEDLRNSNNYTLYIVAKDRGIPQQISDIFTLTILVEEVNDEMPKFTNEHYVGRIAENSMIGAQVIIENSKSKTPAYKGIHAQDPDMHSKLKYEIVEYLSAISPKRDPIRLNDKEFQYITHLFSIDPDNGTIYVKEANIDREIIEKITFKIKVMDVNATRTQQDFAIVDVIIEDVNDFQPLFLPTNHYFKSIFESVHINDPSDHMKELINLDALDEDYNSSIIFSLLEPYPKELITIDSQTGIIYGLKGFDREETDWINITVSAMDTGLPPLISKAIVTIKILDRNDNTPKFINVTNKRLEIYENVPINTVVYTVLAYDLDSGYYGRLSYFITHGSEGNFKIDSNTGVITITSPIDRETFSSYVLEITVRDNWDMNQFNENYNENKTKIKINILDENDNAPYWISPNLTANNLMIFDLHVLENITFESLYRLEARDLDQKDTPNALVKYLMNNDNQNGSNMIEINPNTGDIFPTQNLLDIIQEDTIYSKLIWPFVFSVIAQDTGHSQLTSPVLSIRLYIDDINDHAPQIIYPQFNNFNYTTLSNKIKKSAKDEFAALPVNISSFPTNNNNNNNELYIYYNNASILNGKSVVKIEAIDQDRGINGEISYVLNSHFFPDSQYFELNVNNGALNLQNDFVSNNYVPKVSFQIMAQVMDNGSPRLITNLPMHIFLINNNVKPIFDLEKRTFKFLDVYENVSINSNLGSIPSAITQNGHNTANSKLTDGLETCYFIIAGNIDNTFHLNTKSRKLSTQQLLDRETIPVYTIYILANNDCNSYPTEDPSNFDENPSILKVIIEILDINDNFPKFQSKHYQSGVHIDSKPGRFLQIPFKVIDGDEGDNARQIYQIKNVETIFKNHHLAESNLDFIYENGSILPNLEFAQSLNSLEKFTSYTETFDKENMEKQLYFDPHSSLTNGLSNTDNSEKNEYFTVDPSTGNFIITKSFVNLTFAPGQKAEKPLKKTNNPDTINHFVIELIVCDAKLPHRCDMAQIKIFLLHPEDQIRFQLSMPVVMFNLKQTRFSETLRQITGFNYNIDKIANDNYMDINGKTDSATITSVIGHFVDQHDRIIPFQDVIKILDTHRAHFAQLKMEYDIEKITSPNAQKNYSDYDALTFYKYSFYGTVLCFAITILTLLTIWIPERKKYRRKLKAAMATSISRLHNGISHKHESIYQNQSTLGGFLPKINALHGKHVDWNGNHYEKNDIPPQNDQESDLNSKVSDIWNNISNPSLYSQQPNASTIVKHGSFNANGHNSTDSLQNNVSLGDGSVGNSTNANETVVENFYEIQQNPQNRFSVNQPCSEKNNHLLQKINEDFAKLQQTQIDRALKANFKHLSGTNRDVNNQQTKVMTKGVSSNITTYSNDLEKHFKQQYASNMDNVDTDTGNKIRI